LHESSRAAEILHRHPGSLVGETAVRFPLNHQSTRTVGLYLGKVAGIPARERAFGVVSTIRHAFGCFRGRTILQPQELMAPKMSYLWKRELASSL
jgi:hypothetical protein